MRRLLATALVALGMMAGTAQAFTLGWNDRWDSNYPHADLVNRIGGSQARVFVTVSRAGSALYWNQLDRQVHGLRAAGVRPVWCLADVPSYGGHNTANRSQWAAAARRVIARYGGSAAIEIGNEPDLPGYGGWSPRLYASVFRSTYHAIKAAAPRRRIISAGIPTAFAWRSWFSRFAYLTRDLHYTTGMHEYGLGAARALFDLAIFRRIRPGAPVRVTEIGVNSDRVGLWLQGRLLSHEVAALARHGVSHITIHDLIGYTDGWSMVNDDLSPKPAWYAIHQLAPG